ncbi:MAG: hypothetical protein QM753_17890 [Thermomicrobiales bacterium]
MKQANLGLSADELMVRQAWLQAQVREVVAQRHLLAISSLAGHAEIVGSYAMGLMVWPDIDITVTNLGKPDLDVALQLVRRFMNDAGAHRVNIADHRDGSHPAFPPGIYLGPDIVHDGIAWQVDVWLVDPESGRERGEQTARYMAHLTDTQRRSILAIKQVAAASDVYHRGVSSVDIYSAVLEAGVATPEEFVAWLAVSGRSL